MPLDLNEETFLLPEAEYILTVKNALDKTDKNGKGYILLVLKDTVTDNTIFDQLQANKIGVEKARKFCKAAGIDLKEKKALEASDCINLKIKAKVGIEPGNANYPDARNVIKNYIFDEDALKSNDVPNDDISF